MTTPPEPFSSASIAQRIREKEAQVAALQQEIQQLYRQADVSKPRRRMGRRRLQVLPLST